MYAWAIRKERHGAPEKPCRSRSCRPGRSTSHDVLVLVMAAGVNYNGVWAALGTPISPIDGHKNPYHIAGSRRVGHRLGGRLQGEALEGRRRGRRALQSGRRRRRGMQRRRSDVLAVASASGATRRPMARSRNSARVQDRQLMERPKHLTWEESACYTLTLATTYRMLFGHRPHILRPGHNVLVWGASGGLGSFGGAALRRVRRQRHRRRIRTRASANSSCRSAPRA